MTKKQHSKDPEWKSLADAHYKGARQPKKSKIWLVIPYMFFVSSCPLNLKFNLEIMCTKLSK